MPKKQTRFLLVRVLRNGRETIVARHHDFCRAVNQRERERRKDAQYGDAHRWDYQIRDVIYKSLKL